ncbi:hypothetical protein N7532_010725 [Penicillium argentinense]|uniref:Uncharacterized protein n=1 Tax=Penicillium argentinense TaxID=1131581 RepID=A0A9W9EQC0_9EURO|nr:uncharacterized protein N7532_010725 [Penicillium argentinense]KAJ5085954.1 hypothetical protein N7532_010725 [Penicillium argentinense]
MGGISFLGKTTIVLSLVQAERATVYDEQQQQVLVTDIPNNLQNDRSNIIFILTDQDLMLDWVSYMPQLNKHQAQQGTFHRNHFVTKL